MGFGLSLDDVLDLDLLQFDAGVDRMRRCRNKRMREYIIATATATQGTSKAIKALVKTYTERGERSPGVLTEDDFLRDMGKKGF